MSASSFVPKVFRHIFKGLKKRNPTENTNNTYVENTVRNDPMEYIDYDVIHPDNVVEDMHMRLAVALSQLDAKEPHSADGESTASTRYAAMSMGMSNASEALSSVYYFNGIVEYEDHICDGFYDVWGEFPELSNGRSFPSLKHLKRLRLDDADPREVVLFSRQKDSVFPMLEQAARDAINHLRTQGQIACIQALAQIVSAQMGGAVREERALYKRWQRSSQKAKRSFKSAVFPIGKLRFGLSRHRALLYKILADSLNIGCRLVRGVPYTEAAFQANSLVSLGDVEVIVDLIVQPGRLFLHGGGPDRDPGTEIIYAEAPGMPSEPYWIPRMHKTKRTQQQTEDSCSISQSWPQGFPQETIAEGYELKQHQKIVQPAPVSAFSQVKIPFDPPSPAHMQASDFSREGSSMMSNDPCHDSGKWSNQSAQGGMNRQLSTNSMQSGTSWVEDGESTRQQKQQPPMHRLETNVENRQNKHKKSNSKTILQDNQSRMSNEREAEHIVPLVGFQPIPSPFQGFELPIFDNGDEDQEESPRYHPPSLESLKNHESENKPVSLVGSMSSFFDDDCTILTSEIKLETPRIAVGSYGEVFKGTWYGTDVAVKKLLEQDVSTAMLEV